jgi:predicted  nucleic acid-binding Zn-ribbon protein
MASRRAAIASDSGGTLKKEREAHEITKKQLLDQQQEVEKLKAEKMSDCSDLQELRKHIKQLSQPLQELRKELELESKILIVVK